MKESVPSRKARKSLFGPLPDELYKDMTPEHKRSLAAEEESMCENES